MNKDFKELKIDCFVATASMNSAAPFEVKSALLLGLLGLLFSSFCCFAAFMTSQTTRIKNTNGAKKEIKIIIIEPIRVIMAGSLQLRCSANSFRLFSFKSLNSWSGACSRLSVVSDIYSSLFSIDATLSIMERAAESYS